MTNPQGGIRKTFSLDGRVPRVAIQNILINLPSYYNHGGIFILFSTTFYNFLWPVGEILAAKAPLPSRQR